MSLGDDHGQASPLYCGMRVMNTENRSKALGVVNGRCGKVHSMHRNTIFILCDDGRNIVPVHPLHDEENVLYYPLLLGYSNTIAKVQGQTLSHITVWFDCKFIPPGCAYVALSRVRTFNDIAFLQEPLSSHFVPNS